MRRYLLSFLLVLGVFVGFTLAGSLCTLSAYAAGREAYAAWDTLARAYHEVQSRYVEELDATVLVYAAIEGMVQALDPHSAFLDPERYRSLQRHEQDRYFGIGVRVVPHELGLEIVEVLPDSPARHHAIQTGDIITTIDDHELAGDPFVEASERIAGPRGELVQLVILRQEASIELSLARDVVHVPAVWGELVRADVGYLALVHFQEGSADELRAAITDLQRENGRPLEQLVLDLRNNPGGLLSEAVAVVDQFVGDELIVSTRGREAREDEVYRGEASQSDWTLSPIVLVNGGSASASEIVAGALRTLGRATLVGTATYGKGSVQAIWAFEDESALKLTISRYYLPDDSPIDHRAGLEPDVLVRSSEQQRLMELLEDFEARIDSEGQALRAVDRAALHDALNQVEATQPNPDSRRLWDVPVTERLDHDPQLARALELAAAELSPEE